MKKRIIPQIIFDNSRSDGFGETDFIVCTDVNSGFIAKVELYSPKQLDNLEYDSDISRLVINQSGYGALITILRVIGNNPNPRDIKSLLAKAGERYKSLTSVKVTGMTKEVKNSFLDILIGQSRQNLFEAGSDVDARMRAQLNINILNSIKEDVNNGEGK